LIIAAVSKHHNASVALLEDDKVLFFIENERLSNIKNHDVAFQGISQISNYVDHIDHLVVTGLAESVPFEKYGKLDAYAAQVSGLNKTFSDHGFMRHDFFSNHHEIHAATAFYNSGFETALCIVKDGIGSEYYFSSEERSKFGVMQSLKPEYGRENGTSFLMSYPDTVEVVDRHLVTPIELRFPKLQINNKTYITDTFSEGRAFQSTCLSLGFGILEAGKVMGMSSYGKEDTSIPAIYNKRDLLNKELFSFKNNSLLNDDLNYKMPKEFQLQANFAWKLQTEIQEQVTKYILKMLKETGQKNLCLSGGFFLNCVANYHLLKNLPDDVQIYVEPISSDAGNALGAARQLYRTLTQDKTIRPQTHVYYGLKHNITLSDLKDEKIIENVTPEYVAKLLADKKIVALYQGRSEAGPRALGNRSILYDPRDPNGKDHVNTVKKREWFRPFAGTVLLEKAREWFDLRSLTESKFMMFAVDVWPDKQPLIPAITHVDGTCRMQTLKREDNPNYYDLIQEFNKLTGVPILFNTSFNLAGNTIVETLKDALWTIHNSAIDYLYLPELKVLVTKAS
jgi:carbamoyltransferase